MILFLAALSGAVALGDEIVWTRMQGMALGHDFTATLGVLLGFFGGLAIGAATLGRRIARSPRPERWFAALELAVGLASVALIPLIPLGGGLLARWLGADASPWLTWGATFAITFLLLLPATAAMGGTLPALSAVLARRGAGPTVGRVYAANTAGAVAGCLIATTLLAPWLGHAQTLGLLAALNVVAALGMLALGPSRDGSRPLLAARGRLPRTLAARLFASGLLGIGMEVLGVRVLAQVTENTVYTFAALLAVFLAGTAAGGFAARRASADRAGLLAPALAATSLACLGSIWVIAHADAIMAGARAWLGAGVIAARAGEMVVATCVFLPPTIGMGACFTLLAERAAARGGLGAALGWNTAGAACAAPLFGVLLLPAIGAKAALVVAGVGYAALVPTPASRAGWREAALLGLPILAAVALLLGPVRLDFLRVPPGGALLARIEGPTVTASVLQDAAGTRTLQINNRFRQGGTASQFSDRREAFVPLLLHPAPRRALFLGLGTGATVAAAATALPGVRIDAVELAPEVLPLLSQFAATTGDLQRLPNVALHVADARRFVRASRDQYDVVVGDLFFPAVDGAGSLYTREHFAAVGERLTPGGVFCQWLPLHQMDLDTVRLIARSFLAAFPNATAWIAHFSVETPLLALVGSRAGEVAPDADRVEAGTDPLFRARLAEVGLRSGLALSGLRIATAGQLRQFAGDGPINTEDRPLVTYRAATATYAPEATPAERLVRLLDAMPPMVGDPVAGFPARLAAYRAARDRFIRFGAATRRDGAGRDPIGRLAPELLAITRLSPDFAPAYDPVLAMAGSLATRDPERARILLRALLEANPWRPEARTLLRGLGG